MEVHGDRQEGAENNGEIFISLKTLNFTLKMSWQFFYEILKCICT